MPRISPEARSAAAYRAGGKRPQPRTGMFVYARELWTEIVNDRPVDYFRPGQLGMLEEFCEYTVEGRRLLRELAKTRVGTGDYEDLQRQAARNTAQLVALGTKLRLTVQADVERHSGKTAERGDGLAGDDLIGGTRGGLKVVK
jgi:hypothetical protein